MPAWCPSPAWPLADAFLQATRRGYAKKINTSLAPSILANHFIGTGIRLPADRTFAIALGKKDDRLALVSAEGYLQLLEVSSLPTAIEEVIRLGITDHLVAAFVPQPTGSILLATQAGKLIHRTADSLETAASFKTKGQSLLSPARREQGVRIVAALPAADVRLGCRPAPGRAAHPACGQRPLRLRRHPHPLRAGGRGDLQPGNLRRSAQSVDKG